VEEALCLHGVDFIHDTLEVTAVGENDGFENL
jgi:hypothetical protein